MMKRTGVARLVGIAASALLWAGLVRGQILSSPHLVPATTNRPDEFGTSNYSVTTISATSFTADEGSGWGTAMCCLSRYFNGGSGNFYAGVNIPSGAVIDYIGLESFSFCTGVAGVELWEVLNGSDSGIVAFSSTQHGYAVDYNSAPLGWQLTTNVGHALAIQVQLSSDCAEYPAFSWVEIWWRRAVSPPPASPTFTDVQPGNPFYQYVEAIAASGLTGGCGGGNYCPNNPVTRGQIAVFLAKALGLNWPN